MSTSSDNDPLQHSEANSNNTTPSEHDTHPPPPRYPGPPRKPHLPHRSPKPHLPHLSKCPAFLSEFATRGIPSFSIATETDCTTYLRPRWGSLRGMPKAIYMTQFHWLHARGERKSISRQDLLAALDFLEDRAHKARVLLNKLRHVIEHHQAVDGGVNSSHLDQTTISIINRARDLLNLGLDLFTAKHMAASSFASFIVYLSCCESEGSPPLRWNPHLGDISLDYRARHVWPLLDQGAVTDWFLRLAELIRRGTPPLDLAGDEVTADAEDVLGILDVQGRLDGFTLPHATLPSHSADWKWS